MEPALPAGSCVASANLHPEPSPLAGAFGLSSQKVDWGRHGFEPRAWDTERVGLHEHNPSSRAEIIAL